MSEKFEEMIHDEILAILDGEDPTEAKAIAELNQRIYEESKKYVNKVSSEWPHIIFNWDVSSSSQRFSLDGVTQEQFENDHPEGFLLGYVSLKEFDSILHICSRRDHGELWQLGSRSKLARLVIYLSENRPISPPLVKSISDREVILQGGHHRYAIAKELTQEKIPIYVAPAEKNQIDKLLTVEWKNA
ncbi:ParB/RepB/Spo0J family partition protein [Agarilytica rhodophyticola]|uniref:ParB/RepB/Spo0J family partition protein n=1 Tax=Agarilytica rhodophyticola TaxID=1737490 RepID=UPI000B3465DA|nr:ParB/RepB/Spo0J family partition protein [Agarilytica rhodophyticola]